MADTFDSALALGMDATARSLAQLTAIDGDGVAIDTLWRRTAWILRAAALYPGCFERREIGRVVEAGIVWPLVELLEQSVRRKLIPLSMARRRAAVAQVTAYIDEHLAAPLALTDLCRIAGLKARALQYAFQQAYGVTPMAYLKIMRLAKARQLLRTSDPRGITVSAAAARAGFWHMAAFSQDYRRLFGETPKQTLQEAWQADCRHPQRSSKGNRRSPTPTSVASKLL